jgi:CRISPR/Cas system-associated protein Cas10 (large subunit of type III CRISPR-Cas system)
MIKSTVELLAEVIDDMGETLAYAVLSPKVEEELLNALFKLRLVYSRLANPVTQQETKRHIPDNSFEKRDPELASKVSELIFNSDRPYR